MLAGCGGAGSPVPAGWQPVPGQAGTWATGSGASRQTYAYSKTPYDGTLQDLASREAVNVVLRHRGAKFDRSDVYPPCPGMGAIATFSDGASTLQEGFAVQGDSAVRVLYVRPAQTPDDPAATAAMQRALCVAP